MYYYLMIYLWAILVVHLVNTGIQLAEQNGTKFVGGVIGSVISATAVFAFYSLL